MLSLPDFKEKNIIISFASEGQKVSFKNDNLIIKDAEEKIIVQATCHKIFSLWIVGHSTITTGILERSKKFAFSIYMLSHNHRPYGLWSSSTDGNFLLRRKQYEYDKIDIARLIVSNKIANQVELLKSIRSKSLSVTVAVDKLCEYINVASTTIDNQVLLGIEGVASKLFFSNWYDVPDWKGRKPRAKTDYINTTLDIGYTFLFNFIECMVNLYGFDLYQGVYHKCFYQRKSLICDLVEPYRCIIDKQVKKAIGLKQCSEEHFDYRKGQFFLKPDKNKDYTKWLMQGILENKEDIFTYVQEYYRCFIRDKEINLYPVFTIK